MSTQTLNSRAARQEWRDLLDHALQGGRTIITRDEKPIAVVIGLADLQRLEPPMSEEQAEYTTAAEGSAFHLDDQGDIQPAPQALVQALLTVHHGDRAAAARALLAHIQAEQQALALLLATGGQP